MNSGSKKAIYAAFFANFGIAIAKFTGAAITGSAGLLAEAVHSLADTGNQALLLVGGKKAQRKATEQFQFGYGRERYFWSFVVALVLFSMGGLFALYEGIQKLIHPHESSSLEIAVGILVVAIFLETYSLSTAVKAANNTKPKTMSWFRFITTTKEPELPVVLLEDIGAEAGLFIALFGVITAHFTHNARWDAAGSIAIGLLLIVIALFLAIEMKSLLLGESALPEEQERIANALVADASVKRIIHMRTLHLGPDEILVAAKIDFGVIINAQDLATAIDAAERRCRAASNSRLTIYIEPGISR